jgi:5'-nucleotidase
MRILLTNDDGLMAPGLQALRRVLPALGEVVAVAPDSPRSAAAHAITVSEPIYVRTVRFEDGADGHALSANPADCVKFAWAEVMGGPADLVVSGINDGANAGINVFYSGTVSAAMEGAFLGAPAVAVSLSRAPQNAAQDFERAAQIALGLIRRALAGGLPAGVVLNVNLPPLADGAPKGVRVVPHCTRGYADRFERRTAPGGRAYYWMTGSVPAAGSDPDSDLAALAAGYVNVTPLRCDLTRHDFLEPVRQWRWEGFA